MKYTVILFHDSGDRDVAFGIDPEVLGSVDAPSGVEAVASMQKQLRAAGKRVVGPVLAVLGESPTVDVGFVDTW
jgi:hypothetical protein